MKIQKLGTGASLLNTNHGDEVLYYQGEAVAGFTVTTGYFKRADCEDNAFVDNYLKGIRQVMSLSEEDINLLFL